MSIKNLTVDFGFYGLLDFLQRSFGLIMIPVYTRVLSQTEYGNLDIIIILSLVLLVLVDLQFVSAFARLYLEYCTAGNGKRFVGTAVVSRLIGGIAIPALFLVFGFLGQIEFAFLPSFKANTTVWIVAVSAVPLSLTYDILLLQTRMLRWKKLFALGSVSNCVFSGLLSILFTVVWSWGIVGVVLGLLLGKIIGLLLLVWGLRREVDLCFDLGIFKELLHYSLPLVPGWWVGFSSAYVARFFIYGKLGADENAILAIVTKLAGVIGLLTVSYRTAWQPIAMSYIGDARGEEFYVRSLRLFMAAGVFCIFCLTILSKPVLAFLLPASYGVVEYYIPLFVVGIIIGELENIVQLGNQISKKTYWMSIGSVFSFLTNLLILIIFTAWIGIYAAGLGLMFSSIVRLFITYFSSQGNYRIQYDKKSLYIFCLSCAALLMLSIGRNINLLNGIIFFSAIVVLGIILPWSILSNLDRQRIKNMIFTTCIAIFMPH
jgi:O-antigen/teichoic acid export membrane protein